MAAANDSGFESMVTTALTYDVSLEKLLWEVCPPYFEYKCEEDFITTVQVCTSEDGKKVNVIIFMLNELSLSRIAYIIACLNAFARSVSDKWNTFTYTYQSIVSLNEDHNLNKYIFTSENNTNEDLAGKKQTFITSIR